MSDRSPRVVVVIPTYNERENIRHIVGRVRAAEPAVDVLIVDSASPDGTGVLAAELADADPRVHVIHLTTKEGLGPAYTAGFGWALERGYSVLVEMDADGSHQPEQLGRILAAIDTADVVIGSRWVPDASVRNWPRRREILSRAGNAYIRMLLGLGVRDVTAGFRAYRAAVLRSIDLSDIDSRGYCFQVDLARRAVRAGWRVTEVPIDFIERTVGTSKMSADIVRESLVRVTAWGLGDRANQVLQWARARRARGRDR